MTLETSLDDLLDFNQVLEQTSAELIQPSLPYMGSVTKQDKPQSMSVSDYLVAFTTMSHSYCVGYVDMVNSTKISAVLSNGKLKEYYETFLNSMAKIVGKYDGKVIKNIGDCLLYYFPMSEDGRDLDGVAKCLDCGITMVKAQQWISQKLISNGLPSLSYRVSADYGNVIIMNTNDSKTIDMIGSPVNMCSKINHCAEKNEFVIGGDFHEIIKKIHKYDFREVNGCNIGFKSEYPVYNVKSKQYSYEL